MKQKVGRICPPTTPTNIVVNTLTEQRSRKKKYIQTKERLAVSDIQGLVAAKDGGGKAAKSAATPWRAPIARTY